MKRIIGLLSLVLVAFCNLSAYNYQSVYSHRASLFADSNKNLRGMRIDSVALDGQDSVFYPLKNIQKLDQYCYTPYGASWLGSKILIKPGWNYFFNKDNDTIKIKTDAKYHEAWIMLKTKDVLEEAIITGIDTMTVLGVVDSVKTIDITGYGNDYVLSIILLSKHYGIIKTCNLYNFTKYFDYIQGSDNYFEIYSLVGITNPKIGVQNLTWFDVFDFQVGDELHTSFKEYPYPRAPQYYSENQTIIKYLSRQDFTDSIIYKVDRTQSNPYKHDTIISKISLNKNFDKLPFETSFEPSSPNHNSCTFKYLMNISAAISKTEPPVYDKFYKNQDCWVKLLVDGCMPSYTYLKGLGGPYFKDCTENSLVYYKKGSSTWGVPLVISGINQPIAESNISVLPNPTTDKITISNLTDNCTFELLDLKGSVMLRTTITSSENTLNISNFDKGLYLYRISSNGALLKAGKIVKQ